MSNLVALSLSFAREETWYHTRKPKETPGLPNFDPSVREGKESFTRLVAVTLLLVTAGGAVLDSGAYATSTLSFLSTQGSFIVDFTGHSVLLEGVNYPGYQLDRPKLHNLIAYRALAGFGFNVVRLPISWANFEPQPDAFNATYLSSYVTQDVEWASSVGIYIILDMHQYDWASKFGGCCAPYWTVQNYESNASGMRQAVSDFWGSADLQEHLIQVWVKIAQHFADEPTIAGYDLFNEPWVYTTVNPKLNASALDSFYFRAIQAIRTVDQNHIIFLEPADARPSALLTKTNIVWSPHFYQLSFAQKYYSQNFTLLENDFLAKYRAFVTDSQTPMWIGEFGAFMPDQASRATWITDAMTLFHRYQIGWAWWSYNGGWTLVPDQLYA